MIREWIQVVVLSATAVASTPMQPVAISRQQVAAAVSSMGAEVDESQVDLLASPVSRHENPALEIKSIEPWQEGRLKVRIACRERKECLPFYVGVRTTDLPAFRASRSVRKMAIKEPVVLRTGETATLLLQNGRVQITLPVICLENGSIGRTIRVTTRDRKQIYRAEVVTETLVKGAI